MTSAKKTDAIFSMTGFGAANAETPIGQLSVEVRSVNNRFLDISIRMPREFNSCEMNLRSLIKQTISRGKIDIAIKWRINPELAPQLEINTDALESYARQIREVQTRLDDFSPLPMAYLLELPGVTSGALSAQVDEDTLWLSLKEVVSAALARLSEERQKEGIVLAEDLRGHLAEISRQTEIVRSGADEIVQRYRERLMKKIDEWREQSNAVIDEGRIETEVLFFVDRSDITEELVRLGSHLEKFKSTLDAPKGPAGRDLDFLTQELLREVNTIGSKARDTAIVNAVLLMKSLVEKIREQVQNLE